MSEQEKSARDIEFEAIEEAIMQNPRGRWFLNEYARRNRSADTDLLVSAIEHLYKAAIGTRAEPAAPVAPPASEPEPVAAPVIDEDPSGHNINLDVIRHALADMRQQINAARADMAAIKPRETEHFTNAEADAAEVAASAERATLDILSAVERLQDIADTLRTSGTDGDACDEIETHARGIFMSSAYQDMTGQRIALLVKALTALDNRIAGILSLDDLSDN
ncbi:MAG: hypothetical protein Q7T44_06885 [Parvibaculum sp.]|nr:hypothetical protein [Parvibaculum sp.]